MPPTSNHITLRVEGMHCEGCARRLQRLLADTGGVMQAQVRLAEQQVEVHYDPQMTDLPTVTRRIRDAGFQPSADLGRT